LRRYIEALAKVKKQLLSPCLLAMFVAIATRLVGVTLPG
jgi:predicted permease